MSEKDLNKIKSSFESGAESAPENGWSNLSEGLDNKNLDDKVKASYEAGTIAAPLFDFGKLSENPIDNLVKESYEQTLVAAPAGAWERIFNGLEVDKSWEEIADKIVVKSTAWRTVFAAACLALLVSLIPNYVTDAAIFSTNSLGDYVEQTIEQDQKFSNELLAFSDVRFGIVQRDEHTLVSASELQVNQDPKLIVPERAQERSEIVKELKSPLISKITHLFDIKSIPTHQIDKPKEENRSKWSIGLYGGLNRTWIHDDLSRDAYHKNTTTASKFVIGDMKGISVGYELNDKLSIQTNLFSATSRNKLGMFEHGNYIFRTNQIKFLKANVLLSKSLLSSERITNILLKAGPSFAYVLSNSTKLENKIITFNEGYKKLNIAANLQAGFSYKFSNLVFETGANVELGLRNLIVTSSAEPGSNFTNNMDLGIYTSLRYQF